MRRKDIAAFFGILCYTLTVFAGLYVYYTKTTMLYGTICETESKGYRKEAERKKHSLELRMPCDKSVYKEQASASAEPISKQIGTEYRLPHIRKGIKLMP